MTNRRVYVENGTYRNMKIKGTFDLVRDIRMGKPGRRRNVDCIYYITVDTAKMDPSVPELCGWGNRRNLARIIVPNPGVGYTILDCQDDKVSDVVESFNDLAFNQEEKVVS